MPYRSYQLLEVLSQSSSLAIVVDRSQCQEMGTRVPNLQETSGKSGVAGTLFTFHRGRRHVVSLSPF